MYLTAGNFTSSLLFRQYEKRFENAKYFGIEVATVPPISSSEAKLSKEIPSKTLLEIPTQDKSNTPTISNTENKNVNNESNTVDGTNSTSNNTTSVNPKSENSTKPIPNDNTQYQQLTSDSCTTTTIRETNSDVVSVN